MWREGKKCNKMVDQLIANKYISNELKQAYSKLTAKDPTSFIRIIGEKAKKYIDDNKNNVNHSIMFLVPWIEDPSVKIDRFDARAYLDSYSMPQEKPFNLMNSIQDDDEKKSMKLNQLCNYERFRSLIQMRAYGEPEEVFLKKMQKQYTTKKLSLSNHLMESYDRPIVQPSIAINYTYEDSNIIKSDNIVKEKFNYDEKKDIFIEIESLSDEKKKEIDELAKKYGIYSISFVELLEKDERKAKITSEIVEDDVKILNNMKEKTKEKIVKLRERQKVNQRLISNFYDADIESEVEQPKSILQEEINKALKVHQQNLTKRDKENNNASHSSDDYIDQADSVEYISEFNSNDSTKIIKSTSKRKRKSRFDQLPSHLTTTTTNKSTSTLDDPSIISLKNNEIKVSSYTPTNKKFNKKLTPRELLKRRTQTLIEKQLEMDKLRK